MATRPPPTKPQTEERLKGQPRKPLRFRLIRLEERIAPGAGGNTKKCYPTGLGCYTDGGCYPSW